MTQKLNLRGGFTLVEIMIVVAIIALLASIAVPNFMRARMRSQATAVKNDLRMLDAAVEQYAIENNKSKGTTPILADLTPYLKAGSQLYSGNDSLGHPITIPAIGSLPQVPGTTHTALADVADDTFWAPYTTGSTAATTTGS